MTDDDLYELFVLWGAYQTLHEYLLSTDPRQADPRDFVGPVLAYGAFKAACLIHAHGHGADFAESARIVRVLLAMAQDGHRPRYGAELGVSIEDFA